MSLTRQDWLDLAEMMETTAHSREAQYCERKAREADCRSSCSSTSDGSSAPRDWEREIEAGDTTYYDDPARSRRVLTVSGTYAHYVGAGFDVKFNLTLGSKRPDRPGDGFVHLDHPDWGVGVMGHSASLVDFVAVATSLITRGERSRLLRVFAAGG